MTSITVRTLVVIAITLAIGVDAFAAGPTVRPQGVEPVGDAADDTEDGVAEIVVVGAYSPRKLASIDGSLSLIDTSAIASGAPFSELLARVANLSVSRSGPSGQLTEVRLRGGEANHTVVLLDGVVINDPATGGSVDFSQLLGGGFSRVEVLKGPQSTRYGSAAISGAINVVTEDPRPGMRWALGASAGSHRLRQTDASWSVAEERRFLELSVDRRLSDGVSVSRIEPERDGVRATSVALRGGFDVGRWSFSSTMRSIEKVVENDAQDFVFPPRATQGLVIDADERGRSAVRLFQGSVVRDGDVMQRVSVSLVDSRHGQFSGVDRVGEISAERLRASYEVARSWGRQRVVAALDFDQTRFVNYSAAFSAANFGRTERQWGGALEYRLELDRFTGSLGARHDRNRRFRDATTYRLGGSYRLHPDWLVFASLGSGITNPTFFERFGFFPSTFAGNPGLEPESSIAKEVGLRFSRDAWRVEVAMFDASLDGEIATAFDFSTFTSSPFNRVGESRRRGVEIAGHWLSNDWSVEWQAAYLDAREPDDRVEVRRPRREASVAVARHWGRASADLTVRFSGGLQDLEFIQATPSDRAWLDDFVVVHAGLSVRWLPDVEGYLRVENLFDRDAEEVFGYAMMPRSVIAGLRITRR